MHNDCLNLLRRTYGIFNNIRWKVILMIFRMKKVIFKILNFYRMVFLFHLASSLSRFSLWVVQWELKISHAAMSSRQERKLWKIDDCFFTFTFFLALSGHYTTANKVLVAQKGISVVYKIVLFALTSHFNLAKLLLEWTRRWLGWYCHWVIEYAHICRHPVLKASFTCLLI